MLALYRGITGPGYVNPQKGWCYYGAEPGILREHGAAVSNYSAQQTNRHTLYSERAGDRYVPGLPVSLSLEEAKNWIKRRKYISPIGGVAAVAEVSIPEEMILDNSLSIWRNRGDNLNPYDLLLTAEMLTDHVLGKKPISGECYVVEYPVEALLPYTKIWTPASYGIDGFPHDDMVLLEAIDCRYIKKNVNRMLGDNNPMAIVGNTCLMSMYGGAAINEMIPESASFDYWG